MQTTHTYTSADFEPISVGDKVAYADGFGDRDGVVIANRATLGGNHPIVLWAPGYKTTERAMELTVVARPTH